MRKPAMAGPIIRAALKEVAFGATAFDKSASPTRSDPSEIGKYLSPGPHRLPVEVPPCRRALKRTWRPHATNKMRRSVAKKSSHQELGCVVKTIHNQALGSTLNPMFAAVVILLIRGRIDSMEKVYISAVLLDVASFAMTTS